MLKQVNGQKVTGYSSKGVKLNFLFLSLNSQIIKESRHIWKNSSFCVYLIFTNQPNTVAESRVQHSLHQNCHRQITFSKFNMKIYYRLFMKRPFFTTLKQMKTIFNKQLIFLVGRTHYLTLMLMPKCPFFPILS